MTPIKLEEAKTTNLELFANAADLRRDIHIFVDYVRSHEIKRGHRNNVIPRAHQQRLARLMSDPATAAEDGDGCSPWIEHVDAVCLALKFVAYDTKGIYAGYTSSEPSFPDNTIKFESKPYEAFLGLSLQEQEERMLNAHLQYGSERDREGFGWRPVCEFFNRYPLSRLEPFDSRGSAIGVVPTLAFPKIRRRLLDVLAECPAGVWFSTNSLIGHLQQHDPWFLIPERIPPIEANKWGKRTGRYSNFVERKRGDWGDHDPISDRDPEGFAKVEGRFVERFLEGIPLLLGYTEVAYSKRKTATEIEPSRGLLPAFRVTERLRPALRREIACPKVTVLPNFEVHVESLFFPAKTEAQLLGWGELKQRGIVTVFRLSKPKVAAVMAANPKVSVIDNLKDLSSRDLPANVEAELAEWAGHSEKFILYEGFGLLEGRRDEAGANGFVVEAISPHFALVRSPARARWGKRRRRLRPPCAAWPSILFLNTSRRACAISPDVTAVSGSRATGATCSCGREICRSRKSWRGASRSGRFCASAWACWNSRCRSRSVAASSTR